MSIDLENKNLTGCVTTRDAGESDAMSDALLCLLSHTDRQLCSDSLMLALVKLIEQGIPNEHQHEVARGVAAALVHNFGSTQ